MSCCQKCWRDAHRRIDTDPEGYVAKAYGELVEERKDNPCSPEEQAGEDAKYCPTCKRQSLHEITGECMNCGLLSTDMIPWKDLENRNQK